MEDTGGAAPGKGGTHEQDHSHPEASVLPYYAAALAFVVLCAVLPVYRLWALLAALGAAVLAFAGAKKICRPGWWRRKCLSIPVWTMWMPC